MHVFDVGDLVIIDDNVMFVKELGLFSTTFRRVDGQDIVAQNSILASTKLVHSCEIRFSAIILVSTFKTAY